MSNSLSSCPHCSSFDIVVDYAAGDIICKNCAVVIGDRFIDADAEWRCYANDDRGNGQSAARSSGKSDENGLDRTMILGGSSSLRKSLTKCHMQTIYSKNESKVVENIGLIQNLGSRLGLSSEITESAIHLLSQCIQAKLYIPVDKKPLVVTVLYITCRIHGFPIWIDLISSLSGISSKNIGELYKTIKMELKIDTGRILPSQLILRLASQLKIKPIHSEIARETCNKISKIGLLDGIPPQTIAITLLVLTVQIMTNQLLSLHNACLVSLVTIYSIERTYDIAKKNISIIFSEDFLLLYHTNITNLPDSLLYIYTTTTTTTNNNNNGNLQSSSKYKEGNTESLQPNNNSHSKINNSGESKNPQNTLYATLTPPFENSIAANIAFNNDSSSSSNNSGSSSTNNSKSNSSTSDRDRCKGIVCISPLQQKIDKSSISTSTKIPNTTNGTSTKAKEIISSISTSTNKSHSNTMETTTSTSIPIDKNHPFINQKSSNPNHGGGGVAIVNKRRRLLI